MVRAAGLAGERIRSGSVPPGVRRNGRASMPRTGTAHRAPARHNVMHVIYAMSPYVFCIRAGHCATAVPMVPRRVLDDWWLDSCPGDRRFDRRASTGSETCSCKFQKRRHGKRNSMPGAHCAAWYASCNRARIGALHRGRTGARCPNSHSQTGNSMGISAMFPGRVASQSPACQNGLQ